MIKTHRDGFPWFSARRVRRRDAGASQDGRNDVRRPREAAVPVASAHPRSASGSLTDATASLAASFLPGNKRTRSLWVFITAGWYESPGGPSVAPKTAAGRSIGFLPFFRQNDIQHTAVLRNWPGLMPRSTDPWDKYQGAVIKTHRDRVRLFPGRKEAASDAAHRLGFLTHSGGERTRPGRRLPEAFGRRCARLAMLRHRGDGRA